LEPKDAETDKDKKTKKTPSASELKALNDAKAYIRSLAQLRNRNEQWAVKAVSEGESLSAAEALKLNVINLIAPSVSSLLQSLNGKTVQVNDKTISLQLANTEQISIQPDWRSKILNVIT